MTLRKLAQSIVREWCIFNGIVLEPVAFADLVGRIEANLKEQANGR